MNQAISLISCFHCGAVLQGVSHFVEVEGARHPVCCPGCRASAEKSLGLSSQAGAQMSRRPTCCDSRGETQSGDLAGNDGGLERKISLQVPDIRCAACALLIEKTVGDMPGVLNCRSNLSDKKVVVGFQGLEPAEITATIERLGYHVQLEEPGQEADNLQQERKSMLARLGVAGIGMMQVMMYALANYLTGGDGLEPAYEALMRWASLGIATPIAFYSALPFHRGAWRDFRNRNPGMDVPVSLAILAAYLLSTFNTLTRGGEVYFDSLSMFAFFLLIGRYIELGSRQEYQRNRQLHERLLPACARVLDGGRESQVPVKDVCKGQQVKVSPGEVIPVDGLVLTGKSSADESAFTGESRPVSKGAGSRVLAGSRNLDGELVLEVSKDFQHFVISKLAELTRDASLYRPRFSILADIIARYFISGVLLIATFSAAFWLWQDAARVFPVFLTVLVVSCPCALSLATPVAYTVAVSALGRLGVAVSHGAFLEKLAPTDTIIFDKTGTLSKGRLSITEVRLLSGLDQERVLDLAAALEADSCHPIAAALERPVSFRAAPLKTHPGAGVEGCVDGIHYRFGKASFAWEHEIDIPEGAGMWVLLAADKPLAWIRFSDQIREEACQVIGRLRGLNLSLVTGDREEEARRLAVQCGIPRFTANATPQQKVAAVKESQNQGRHVLMVGDGINDAAAMGLADVSIAVNPVDILVQESADATLLSQDLKMLPRLLAFAARTRRVIRQNIAWAVAYNVCVIPLAVAGVLEPWMAALGMSMSSLLVVLNARRLSLVPEGEE